VLSGLKQCSCCKASSWKKKVWRKLTMPIDRKCFSLYTRLDFTALTILDDLYKLRNTSLCTILDYWPTVQAGYLGGQMRDEREGGSGRKKVSVRVWYETFAPLRSFDHLLIVLRTVTHVSNG
jgi:hypothetical protein